MAILFNDLQRAVLNFGYPSIAGEVKEVFVRGNASAVVKFNEVPETEAVRTVHVKSVWVDDSRGSRLEWQILF